MAMAEKSGQVCFFLSAHFFMFNFHTFALFFFLNTFGLVQIPMWKYHWCSMGNGWKRRRPPSRNALSILTIMNLLRLKFHSNKFRYLCFCVLQCSIGAIILCPLPKVDLAFSVANEHSDMCTYPQSLCYLCSNIQFFPDKYGCKNHFIFINNFKQLFWFQLIKHFLPLWVPNIKGSFFLF